MATALPIAIAFAVAAAPHPAANPKVGKSQLISAIQNCQAIKDSTARLACYDQAASALVTATTRGDVAIVDASDVVTGVEKVIKIPTTASVSMQANVAASGRL